MKNQKKRARLYLLTAGLLLIILGFSFSPPSSLEEPEVRLTASEVDSFAKEPVIIDKDLLKKISNDKNNSFSPQRIIIPSVDIDLPVRKAKVINGYWEVFTNSAGFGEGSAYPGQLGNQVIFAHAKKGLFLPLKKVKKQEKILILTVDKWYEYKVEEIKEVLPSQTEVIAPTLDETLTLYTCSGFSDNKRLIIIAKR